MRYFDALQIQQKVAGLSLTMQSSKARNNSFFSHVLLGIPPASSVYWNTNHFIILWSLWVDQTCWQLDMQCTVLNYSYKWTISIIDWLYNQMNTSTIFHGIHMRKFSFSPCKQIIFDIISLTVSRGICSRRLRVQVLLNILIR